MNVWYRDGKSVLQVLTTKLATISEREWIAVIGYQGEGVNAVHQIGLLLLLKLQLKLQGFSI